MDQIEVRRPSTGYSGFPLMKGTNDWNHFTLLEVLAMQYDLLATLPAGQEPDRVTPAQLAQHHNSLAYPDLSRLRIRRLGPDGKTWQEQVADLSEALRTTNHAVDLPLKWGDIVEIPEQDHPMSASWRGFSGSDWPSSAESMGGFRLREFS